MSSSDVLKAVLDNSEQDVPAKDIPKDISSREEKKILRRHRNAAKSESKREEADGEAGDLFGPNRFPDSLYSPTQFTDDTPEDDKGDASVISMAQSQATKSKAWEQKQPVEIIAGMYTRFATCVSLLGVPDANGASVVMVEEDHLWDNDDLTAGGDDDGEIDEQEQIHRLTSWNTLETVATSNTFGSDQVDSVGPGSDPNQPRARSRRVASRRRRIVKFDYPIISSLRECPRPDPKDLPKLYFTEEELGQIEDDRESTYTADDVEVVCVSTSNSTDGGEDRTSPSSMAQSVAQGRDSTNQNNVGGNNSMPSPRGGRAAARSSSSKSVSSENTGAGQSRATAAKSKSGIAARSPRRSKQKTGHGENGRKRHIKSVQIYLRERSRDRSPRS